MTEDPRRSIPAVDALLLAEAFAPLVAAHDRARLVRVLRGLQDEVRGRLAGGGVLEGDPASPAWWAGALRAALDAQEAPSLRPVLNATGVVLHTNLGRAPLAPEARDAMARAAEGYGNLEFDLEAGVRGSRYDHGVPLLRQLTGAQDGLVVNNAAAALVLALNTVARGRGVAVSRGELVEIGGGFRIPEILERSGARLVEVGSTNRTRLRDYAAALAADDVAAVLKVHRSNFRISGFTEETGLEELAGLTREAGIPLLFDLGSGLLADPGALGLPPEPRAPEALAAGADLVVVSGDKLLGGPQAGIVVGTGESVAALRSNPLCRALRVDKVTLAGLEATLRLYLDPGQALERIPTLRMLRVGADELRQRAEALARALEAAGVGGDVVPHEGAVGGGTYPDHPLPSWALALRSPAGAEALAAALRRGIPPVVGRIDDDALLLDLRTIHPGEDAVLARRVEEAWAEADR